MVLHTINTAHAPLQGPGTRRALRCVAHASSDRTPPSNRRAALAAGLAAAATLPTLALPTRPAAAEDTASEPQLDAFTDRVFLEFGLCPEGVRQDRRLGDKTILCTEPEPLGRVVIGLFGNAAPGTVANFKTLIASQALTGTAISKILAGQWIVAGQQGPHRSGLLEPPEGLARNPDLLSAAAFRLRHLKPGTLSLNLAVNEDAEGIRLSKGYSPLGFLITTGPAPAPSLDGENIVFGRVLEGLDVISAVAAVPTFQPYGNAQAFNQLANFIGDERAAKTRSKWGKPLKAVVITSTGTV